MSAATLRAATAGLRELAGLRRRESTALDAGREDLARGVATIAHRRADELAQELGAATGTYFSREELSRLDADELDRAADLIQDATEADTTVSTPVSYDPGPDMERLGKSVTANVEAACDEIESSRRQFLHDITARVDGIVATVASLPGGAAHTRRYH